MKGWETEEMEGLEGLGGRAPKPNLFKGPQVLLDATD